MFSNYMVDRLREGSVLSIPIDGQAKILAKVVYVSGTFRNVIGVRVLTGDATSPQRWQAVGPVFYTTAKLVGKRWPIIGDSNVTELDHDLTTRVVGGSVWRRDLELRPACAQELRELPRMGVLGYLLFEQQLASWRGDASNRS